MKSISSIILLCVLALTACSSHPKKVKKNKPGATMNKIIYADGSNNVYVINSKYIEYKPMTAKMSSSGTYSGGKPVKKSISSKDYQKLVVMIKKAQEKKEEQTDKRMMMTGQVEMTENKKQTVFILQSGSPSKNKIEAFLKEMTQ